jgi:hypothetical protein
LGIIRNVIEKDKDGIVTATPLLVYKSLSVNNQKLINKDLICTLGQINLLGWCAYMIYDGIIDKDSDTDQLPIANIICREMEIEFEKLPIKKETGFFELYKKIMQEIEISNWHELNHWRFDLKKDSISLKEFDFNIMANRSMGHALSSIAILCKLNLSTKSLEVKKLLSYFKCFIIARQMNDDAHDWLEDFNKGQINSANYQMIKKYNNNLMNLNRALKDKNKVKLEFWKEIIPNYCKKIVEYGNEANKNLKELKIINNKYLMKLNQNNINIANKTLEESTKTLEFVKHYYL